MDKLIAFFKRRATLLGLFAIIYIGHVLVTPLWLYAIVFDDGRAWNMMVAYDRFANSALNGDPKQTLSERAYYGMKNGSISWCLFCRLLSVFHKDHCEAVVGAAVDGVRAETIHESSIGESLLDFIRTKAGVFLVRLRDIGRAVLARFGL